MNITADQNFSEALIAGITPYFLERGELWFAENLAEIKKKARQDEWWRNHILFLEKGEVVRLSPFLRKLADLGYVKVSHAANRGEFATRGGIVDVFPVNLGYLLRIEFTGNTVERIMPLKVEVAPQSPKLFAAKDASSYERLWLADLKNGDYVVHIDHGIGIFRGMASTNNESVRINEYTNGSTPLAINSFIRKFANNSLFADAEEYYTIEYAPARRGGHHDRLLVPRHQAQKLSRYVGFETPAIHRLGSDVWEKTKRKAKENALTLARELMELFKNRAKASRDPYPKHQEIEKHLEETFSYEETDDQLKALEEIHDDLSRERPMDRLLLGDVGFGKTEVALRITARAAYSGRQVAVLVPTTILADQHFATFSERLKNMPTDIAVLSRLTPKKEIKAIIENIAAGKINVVIGTHRLLSGDIVWKDLGLVIIDEEQRFGVKHKEKFKQLRSEIDILSLSATPIPRTLSLAIAKFRDLSIIQNPPRGRTPIKTFVLPFSKKIVAEAIQSEIRRRGQIFYLWNRIENIESVRRYLENISPQSRIAVLHGRMHESALIRTMHEFRAGKIDILLATTIIENGLDLPGANTLIVANASRLGLAQAYQIRGRVGRGDIPAYAYLLYPARSLTEKGKMRLAALKGAENLGAGFQIALKDLEIRGAGNVLGKQQSGAVNKVGLNLYAQLLNEAVEELS